MEALKLFPLHLAGIKRSHVSPTKRKKSFLSPNILHVRLFYLARQNSASTIIGDTLALICNGLPRHLWKGGVGGGEALLILHSIMQN